MPLTGIDLEGDIQLKASLQKLPQALRDEIMDPVGEYLLNIVQTYPPKRHVTRKAAYGQTFQSDKQRRWFFANLKSGAIQVPYRRTQGLRHSWTLVGKGQQAIIVSESEAAVWTMSDLQSRHEAMVGWKKISKILQERMGRVNQIIDGAAKRAIRKLGFK